MALGASLVEMTSRMTPVKVAGCQKKNHRGHRVTQTRRPRPFLAIALVFRRKLQCPPARRLSPPQSQLRNRGTCQWKVHPCERTEAFARQWYRATRVACGSKGARLRDRR